MLMHTRFIAFASKGGVFLVLPPPCIWRVYFDAGVQGR